MFLSPGRWQPLGEGPRFGFDARDIAFVLLTHAHIDHSGLVPRLVAQGFRGAVYATGATVDLLGVMLPDSGYLQEKETEWSGKAPLYTQAEAQGSLGRLVPVAYDSDVAPHPAVRARFRDAGHILGSAIIELHVAGKKVVFSAAQVAARRHLVLQAAFAVAYWAAGEPTDAALFSIGFPEAGDTYTLFFSPLAATIAPALVARYGATDCDAPPGLVSMLVGHLRARRRLLGSR